MNSPARTILYPIILTFLLLYISISLRGQNISEYRGPVKIGSYDGYAEYFYQHGAQDTTLHGNFSLQSLNLDALHASDEQFISIDGVFKSGLPDGTWRFQFGDFAAEDGVEFDNYQLKIKVNGIQHTAIINFVQGEPEGEWIQSIRKIENSEVKKTAFVSSSSFAGGVARGNLRIKNDSLSMLGRFLRNGLAHDIWELNFEKEAGKLEKWFFTNGRLEKIVIDDVEATEELLIYPNEIQQEKLVNLDNNYLKIIALQNRYDSLLYAKWGGRMSHLIRENASYYQKIETILTDLKGNKGESTQPEYLVKVAHYPLNAADLEKMVILEKNLQAIDTINYKLTNSTRLNILKHSDEEVLYLLSALEEITNKYILPVRMVVSYHSNDLLEYFPIAQMQWPQDKQESLTEIKVNYQDSSGFRTRTFVGPAPENLEAAKTGIPYLIDLSEYALNSVIEIEKKLGTKVKQYNIQKELENLEKELLIEENRLIFMVDSLVNKQSTENESLRDLKITAIAELARYAAEEDFIAKPARVRQLIKCMKTLQQLTISLAWLPSRVAEIEELYTEQVWNPFTATIMNDQVKQRLTNAYMNVLLPHIRDQIKNELTCNNSEKYLSMINELYDKMIMLRNQDTSRLERKLKKENDPKVVLQLFELAK